MLLHKTHHSIVRGSITSLKHNFQLNLTCFHMVAKKDLAIVLDACWRSVVFITPPPICPWKRTLVSAEQVAGQAKQLVQILWKREKYLAPTSIRNTDILTMACSLIGYAIPAPTAISKYLSIRFMNFQAHCLNDSNQEPMRTDMNH